jgi:arsenate reductase (thioredoxin)
MESESQLKKRVLFLCYHNSARSQMAEGLLRAIYGDRYEAHSAGIKSTHVDPRAIKVMNEIGINISNQRSKSLDEYRGAVFDLAVTVCDKTREMCPICGINIESIGKALPAEENIHRTFEDPATATGTYEEQLNAFRYVRDEMRTWIVQTSFRAKEGDRI